MHISILLAMLTDVKERQEYFQAYNAARPNMVLRLVSVAAKEAIRAAATAAGEPMQDFVFDRLVLRLVDEAMEAPDENLD